MAGMISIGPTLPFLALLIAAVGAGAWWMRSRYVAERRRTMRVFHTLSEEIIAAQSPAEIAKKLGAVLPSITRATSARIYVYNRQNKSLESVPTDLDPEPSAAPVDSPPEGLAGAAVTCFRNRTILNVPDVRRSPFAKSGASSTDAPLSAVLVPMSTQNDVLGVLEAGNANRPGYFSPEEHAVIQHLANQAAAALRLQDQRAIREQLFRGEKLAATGQLIAGVAAELYAPLERILDLSAGLAAVSKDPECQRDLQQLVPESQRAAEIVARLLSFARQESSAARLIDVNALLGELVQFREPEWKLLSLRGQNRLPAVPAMMLGARGQLEQVFLTLLVYAEQAAIASPGKHIAVSATRLGRRLLIDIQYASESAQDPFPEGIDLSDNGAGLGVCRSLVRNHGGELRFRAKEGSANFEIELPLAQDLPAPLDSERHAAQKTGRPLTLLLIDADAVARRRLLTTLAALGHRVIPVAADEAVDLTHRMKFDGVFWSVRSGGPKWGDFQERLRSQIPAFVLVSDGYDAQFADSLAEGGGFLLGRPIQDADLAKVLEAVESRSTARVVR